MVGQDGAPLACSRLELVGHLTGPALWMRARQFYREGGLCRLTPPADGCLTNLRLPGRCRRTQGRAAGPQNLDVRVDAPEPLEVEWVQLLEASSRHRVLRVPFPAASNSLRLRFDEPMAQLRFSTGGRERELPAGRLLEVEHEGPAALRLELDSELRNPCVFESAQTVLLGLTPPSATTEAVPRDLVFYLGPGTGPDYPAVASFLEKLPIDDRFGLVASTRAGLLALQENWLEPAQAGAQAGLWLRAAADLEGEAPDPDIVAVAEECLRLLGDMARVQYLVLVLARPPEASEGAALEAMMASALAPRVVVVTPESGAAARRLAHVSRGAVLAGEGRFERLAESLAEPLATDPVLVGEGVHLPPELVAPERLPDLHRGRLSWALGRASGRGGARLHALVGETVWEQGLARVPTDNPGLPCLAAWVELRDVLDRAALEAGAEPPAELVQRVLELGLLTPISEWECDGGLRLEPPAQAEPLPSDQQEAAFTGLVPQLLDYCQGGRLRLMVEMGRPLARLERDGGFQLLALPWRVYLALTAFLGGRLQEGESELYGCLPDGSALQVRLEKDGLVYRADLTRLELRRDRLAEVLEERLDQVARLLERLTAEPELRSLAESRRLDPRAPVVWLHDQPRLQERMERWLQTSCSLDAELGRIDALLQWGASLVQGIEGPELPAVERFQPGWDLRIEHWVDGLRAWCSSS